MKKNQGKKLQLNAEKVRELSAADADAVLGGAPPVANSKYCAGGGGKVGTSISESTAIVLTGQYAG